MSRHSARGTAYNRLRHQWLYTADHGWTCHLCGRPVEPDLPPRSPMSATVDHLVPTSHGADPLDTRYWRLAHLRCNSRRQQSTIVEPVRGATRRW